MAVHAGAAAAVTVVVAALVYWSPYLISREALLKGDSVSIGATASDRVFLSRGWSKPFVQGTVVARLAAGERVSLYVPLPQRRPYRLVLRMDAPPGPDRPPQHVRLFMGDKILAVFELGWNPERVGQHQVELAASDVSPGRVRLDLVSDYATPLGLAGDLFPEVPRSTPVAFRYWYLRVIPL